MNILASSTPQGGILVTSILKSGPVAKQGSIRVGDELLEVNNSSLKGMNQQEVLTVLSSLTGEIQFEVIRTPDRDESSGMIDENVSVRSGETRKLDQVRQ